MASRAAADVPGERPHLPALDGLRGVAIALVVLHNSGAPQGDLGSRTIRAFDIAVGVGWVGVQLFFVLSGFLITGILLDTKAAPNFFGAFYMRRVLRIFPLYYASLLGFFVIAPLLLRMPAWFEEQRGAQIYYWLYVSNWSALFGRGVTGLSHFWSLAVEEQFYLVWPLVVFATTTRNLARVCAAVAVASLAARAGMRLAGLSPEWAYESTAARADALVIGALAAILERAPERMRAAAPRLGRWTAALGGLLCVVALATRGFGRINPWVQTLGQSLLALFFAAVVLLCAGSHPAGAGLRKWLGGAAVRAVGKYSYAIYVFQLPIRLLAEAALGERLDAGEPPRRIAVRLAFVVGVLGASFLAALISWHLLEKRFLALKRLFVAQASRGAGAGAR